MRIVVTCCCYCCLDVVEVSPRRGSQMGGTRISITVSNSLVQYEEDVEVFVGGERWWWEEGGV